MCHIVRITKIVTAGFIMWMSMVIKFTVGNPVLHVAARVIFIAIAIVMAVIMMTALATDSTNTEYVVGRHLTICRAQIHQSVPDII